MADLQNITVPNEVMQQTEINHFNLNGVKLMDLNTEFFCIDCLSRWSEGKAVTEYSAATAANFLNEVICRHGSVRTQINDQ